MYNLKLIDELSNDETLPETHDVYDDAIDFGAGETLVSTRDESEGEDESEDDE